MKEVKIGTMAPVCFTAASAFSNSPAPARTVKTAHNSPRFLMETRLRQCSPPPQGLISPDRRGRGIRKRYPRSMQSGTIVPIFTSSQVFRPKLGLDSVVLWLKSYTCIVFESPFSLIHRIVRRIKSKLMLENSSE